MQPPSPPEYYFGDAYRKYAHSHNGSSSSGGSSGPGSPSSNGSYVFGSLFVSAESVTPYTDATQVRDRGQFSCEAAVNWFLGN